MRRSTLLALFVALAAAVGCGSADEDSTPVACLDGPNALHRGAAEGTERGPARRRDPDQRLPGREPERRRPGADRHDPGRTDHGSELRSPQRPRRGPDRPARLPDRRRHPRRGRNSGHPRRAGAPARGRGAVQPRGQAAAPALRSDISRRDTLPGGTMASAPGDSGRPALGWRDDQGSRELPGLRRAHTAAGGALAGPHEGGGGACQRGAGRARRRTSPSGSPRPATRWRPASTTTSSRSTSSRPAPAPPRT